MTTSRRALLRSAAGVGGALIGSAALPASPAEAATVAPVEPGTTQVLTSISGSVTLDLSKADTFACTVTGPTNFTFANWPTATQAGNAVTTEPTVIVTQDATGNRAISFNHVTWLPAGSTPIFDQTAGSTDVISFISADQGATVYGQGGSFDPAGGGFGVYGDGSDGDVVLDGNNTYPFLGKGTNQGTDYYWILRDVYLSSLTVPAGAVLQLAGGGTAPFRLFCSGTVNISAGGFIVTYVNHATSGSTGGHNLTGGTLAPGASAANGATANSVGTAGTSVLGVYGGTGDRGTSGNGGANSAGTAGGAGGNATLPAGYTLPHALPWASMMAAFGPNVTGTTQFFPGGASGGAGAGDGSNAGGAGGVGGNPLFIAARALVNNGSINANGGNGGNAAGGNAGGGGGGQGGPIMLISSAFSGTGKVTSAGGVPGNGAGSGKPGIVGGPSWTIQLEN